MKTVHSVLFLILVPFLALGRAVFSGETIGAFGLAKTLGLKGVDGQTWPVDFLQLDGVFQTYVWRDLVLSAWRGGELPLWNPWILYGTPLLANSQSGGLYPPHILLGLAGVPTGAAIVLLAWFHLSIAGMGAYGLLRVLGRGEAASAVAGAGIALSPFMLGWLPLASVPTTVAWIPVALMGVALAVRGQSLLGAGWTGLGVGMMLLGGHLQFAFYGFLALGLFGLGFAAIEKGWRNAWAPLLGIGLGALLAWGQLSLVLDFSRQSHRANVPTEAGFLQYQRSALQFEDLGTLVASNMNGNPVAGARQTAYWPYFMEERPNAAPAETALTIGFLAFLGLFLVDWRRDRVAWVFGGIAVVGGLLAFGSDLNRVLYFGVPGWSATGSPGRALILLVLGLSLASAGGWSRVLKSDIPARTLGIAVGIGIVSAFAASFLFGPLLAPEWARELRESLVAQGILDGSLQLLVGSVLFGLFLIVWNRFPKWAAPALVGIAVLNLVGQGAPQRVPLGTVAIKPTPSTERLHIEGRISGGWMDAAVPNWSALQRVPRPDGYDSLIDRDTVAFLRAVNGDRDPAIPINGNFLRLDGPLSLTDAGVDVLEQSELLSSPRRAVLGGMRANLNRIRVRVVSDSFTKTVVEVPAAGRLTLMDRNMRGWRAFQNGQELPIEPGLWRVLDVPAAGRVDFIYRPYSVHPLVWLGAGILAISGLFWVGRNKNRDAEPVPAV